MQVGWIDFSAEDRSRTLTVLNALSQPGSVDELGFGIVRDAMADKLFPGTSTLLTRARYFFLVPYLSRLMEEGHDTNRRDPRTLANEFRDHERRCAEGLLRVNASSEGVIGRVALGSGKWVTRGPGEIYWASLRNLGFMREGSPDSYSAQFSYLADARLRERHSSYVKNQDEDDGLSDDGLSYGSMWRLPRSCYEQWREDWGNWKEQASIGLTPNEARFLQRRITESRPQSLYALILSDDTLRTIALATLYGTGEEERSMGDSSFHAFLHNGALDRINSLAPGIAHSCALAEGFSEVVYGCRIAYNMQLTGLEEQGEREWNAFAERASSVVHHVDLDSIAADLGLTNHGGFMLMKAFLIRAMACMEAGDLPGLQREVRQREAAIKGARRKIGRTDHGDYAWRGGRRLPYRFANAMGIVREICEAGGCDA